MRQYLLVIISLSFFMFSCTVKKREARAPVPSFKEVSTDFFFEFSKDRKTYKPRRFIFGISSEDLAGSRANRVFLDHYNTEGHSNIEFEFNEEGDKLLARLVNPTYPEKKEKWPIVLSFKISKNYYKESARDSLGRESSNQIQRTDKSDPRARPYIMLELSSLNVIRNSQSLGRLTHKIEDIEWSEDGRFLGFTRISGTREFGREAQSRDRVNFLRIDPTPEDFVETPFNKQNDKYINLLHILGERPNHFGERLKVVHWDINSKTKKKHLFYLHGFPERYLQVGINSIESWNDAFEKVVGYKPFEYKVSQRKYAFDLRYHTITWVNDIRLSASGMLGVANLTADLTSGRVLWTGLTIWGGLIDYYVNRSTPSIGLVSLGSMWQGLDISYLAPKDYLPKSKNSFGRKNDSEALLESLLLNVDFTGVQNVLSKKTEGDVASNKELIFKNAEKKEEVRKLYNFLQQSKNVAIDLDKNFATTDSLSLAEIQKDIGLGINKKPLQERFNLSSDMYAKDVFKNLPKQLRSGQLDKVSDYMKGYHFDGSGDVDVLSILRGAKSGLEVLTEKGKPVDVFEAQKSLVKSVLLHEMGHGFGLGHNFKGNILPEEGSIPKAIYDALHKDALNGMKNRTTVMDYYDGFSEVLMTQEEQQPGPGDLMSLRYLYKQEFPLYDKSLKGRGDYKWKKLNSDGLIPSQQREGSRTLTPGYLPSCNDVDASFYSDPYCNRHDRGYDAESIVEAYFADFWQDLYANLESSSDTLQSRDYKRIEGYLWQRAITTFSRTRFFYDYMRLKYRDKVELLKSAHGDVFETYDNLMSFSQSCQEIKGLSSEQLSSHKSSKVKELFLDKNNKGEFVINEFGSLCLATASFFRNANKMLQIQGKEYTEIDYLNKRSSGNILSGEARPDYSQFYGSWKKISLFPIKFTILQSVLMPFPSMNYNGYQVPLYPYNRADTSFNMSTLYPQEFLKLLRSLSESSLNISSVDGGSSIAKSLLYMGYFLRFQKYSNDFKVFPAEILDALLNQTQFRFTNVIIEVDAEKETGSEYANSFRVNVISRNNLNGSESVGDAYLYTLDRFIMKSPVNSLVLPVSPIRWRTPSKGIAWGIKLDYSPSLNFQKLERHSPRNFFISNYESVLDSCIEGGGKGLSSFFNSSSKNKGIKIPYDITKRPAAYADVNQSVIEALANFSKEKNFDLGICERALKAQKLLVIGAGLMNGQTFEETNKYLDQGEE